MDNSVFLIFSKNGVHVTNFSDESVMNDFDGSIAVVNVVFVKGIVGDSRALNVDVAANGGLALGFAFLGDVDIIAGLTENRLDDSVIGFNANSRRGVI